ncbi:winged helix DNA-binding domain-containing protein [Thermomonospora umbrina]|uniref:Winged helix DNA-binding protein n=1 Tax=Thermomonospora umbrina TaxID=111806 RepID=A0A3D9SM82_9ACTN|nr:winged helix DNA-binding domain-containing protein [Thermomonospora umbrina]REE97032.1 winged helix DNA-binding protein [Thermomonospora umbrina]
MAVERWTWRQVCARRLERHGLAGPLKGGPVEVVAAMAGTHAQVMSAAELAIGLRSEDVTRQGVREALWGDRTLVKTFAARGTVHLVPSVDLPMWTGVLSGLPSGTNGLPDEARMSPEQTDEVIEAIGAILADEELTVDELTEALGERVGAWAVEPVMPAWHEMWPRWRQITHEAAARGALCFGPAKGRKVTYTNPHRWLPGFKPAEAEAADVELLKRYLWSYGPSTPARFAHWLSVTTGWAKGVFEAAAGGLRQVEVEGRTGWVAADDTEPGDEPPRGLRLLPYFDGYAYRVGNQPPELLYPGRAGERVLPHNFQVLVIDGVVAGLWHQRRSGRRLAVTVEALEPLGPRRLRELDEQVERIGHILEATPELTLGPVTVGGHP